MDVETFQNFKYRHARTHTHTKYFWASCWWAFQSYLLETLRNSISISSRPQIINCGARFNQQASISARE